MSKPLGQLQYELEEVKEQIANIGEALAHDEYSKEFDFSFKPALTSKDFTLGGLKELVEGCNAAYVHIIPDVVTQEIEKELFNRMSGFVKTHITGKSVPYLMNMKNELERRMLKDTLDNRAKKLASIEAELSAFAPAGDDKVDELAKSYTPPVEPKTKSKKK